MSREEMVVIFGGMSNGYTDPILDARPPFIDIFLCHVDVSKTVFAFSLWSSFGIDVGSGRM